MADYSNGLKRTQYLEASGMPVDLVEARTLHDPCPALISLVQDVDDLHWGLGTSWGWPPCFVHCRQEDGGSTGSSGSFATADAEFPIYLLVPPRVEWARVVLYMVGALEVDLVNSNDAGVRLSYVNTTTIAHGTESEMVAVVGGGVGGVSGLTSRAMKVSSTGTNNANVTGLAVTVKVRRADLFPSSLGEGGVLYGVAFHWERPALGTWRPYGMTATDSDHYDT